MLGVEVDPRMAAFATEHGFDVEVGRFEEWDPAGRSFDAIVSGQTWHSVDPGEGAAKAAGLLRPRAVSWRSSGTCSSRRPGWRGRSRRSTVGSSPTPLLPPVVATRSTATSGSSWPRPVASARRERSRSRSEGFDWSRPYAKEEWLDQVPSFGGHGAFPEAKLEELLAGIGQAIDAAGGGFTMRYATLAVVATVVARE